MNIRIRNAKSSDLDGILGVFKAAVSHIDEYQYSSEQKAAWLLSVNKREKWLNRIKNQYFILAEKDAKVIGFTSLKDSYLDVLFVDPSFHRLGIASQLYCELENHAIKTENRYIETHASKSAKDFFLSNGFSVLEDNEALIEGHVLNNYLMKKNL